MAENSTPKTRWQSVKVATAFISPYKRQIVYSLLALFFTAAITLSIGQGIRLLIDQGFATQSKDLLSQYVLIFWRWSLPLRLVRSHAITG